jgi:hypothetical protein
MADGTAAMPDMRDVPKAISVPGLSSGPSAPRPSSSRRPGPVQHRGADGLVDVEGMVGS